MKHDPNQLTARDMFLMSVLPAIASGVIENAGGDTGNYMHRLKTVEHFAPEIAAVASRIADAVMTERAKGAK